MNNKIDELLEWFRDKDNLANLRTATTIAFILIFVIYFYGFRTGFQITLNDISDIIIDIVIILVSAFMVINDFALRGINSEIKEQKDEYDNETEERRKYLLFGLIKRHEKETEDMDEDLMHDNLVFYNLKKDREEMENKKREKVKKLKQKRRKYNKGKRKYNKITKKIEHYENPETHIKVKRKHITVSDLKRRGALRDSKKIIDVSYSPRKDTVSSQSSMVFVIVIFTAFMRFGLDPSWQSFGEALMFLGFLVPFLLIRAVISYQMGRYNTKENYPLAIKEQLDIIKWCKNYKEVKE